MKEVSSRFSRRDALLLFAGALLLRLATLSPAPATPAEERLLGDLPGSFPASPVGLRLGFAFLGALAAPMLGAAGGSLGGRAAGWIAGGLVAIGPFALRSSVHVGPAGPLLAGAAAALWLLVRLADGNPKAAAAVALALPAAVLLAAGAPATFRDLADPASSRSPLLAGLRALAGMAGIPVVALAGAGAVAAARRARPADRALLAATAGAFVATLLLGPADPSRLAATLPGLLLLGALAVSPAAPLPVIAARPGVRRLVASLVLAWALVGAATIVAGRWTASPEEKARAWIERNVPPATPMLAEGGVRLPSAIEIPASGASPDESPLFYDPNVAKLFEWILLEERADASDGASVRSRFRAWLGGNWDEVAHFGSVDRALGSTTMFRRPPGWAFEPLSAVPVVEPLAGPEAVAVRDTSRAFTDWVRRAGVAFRAAGKPVEAKGLLQLASMRDSTDARTRYELGLALLILEEKDAAKVELLAALDGDPFHGATHYNLGTILEGEGDTRGAEVEYLAAIAHLEDPSPAHARLGALLASEGNLEGARAHLAELVARDPNGEATQFLAEAVVAAESAP